MSRFAGLIRPSIVVSALVMAICLAACERMDKKPAGPPEKVTIAYATAPYTVLADIALAQGYFKLEGLEVTPHFHVTGKAALDEVLAGKADFATAADTPLMFSILNGHQISIIATIQSSNKNNGIVARKDRGISTPQDMKGKKLGVSLGTISEFFADAFLASHSMGREAVIVVDLKPEEIPKALARGDIDAASAFPPLINEAQNELGGNAITFYDEDIFTQTFNMVATTESIRKNPELVKKILLALLKAEEFAKQHPAEAQKSVADFRGNPQVLLSKLWADNTFIVSLDQALVLALEDESRWAIKNRLTRATKVPNYLDFIYMDGLLSIKSKAVRILK